MGHGAMLSGTFKVAKVGKTHRPTPCCNIDDECSTSDPSWSHPARCAADGSCNQVGRVDPLW